MATHKEGKCVMDHLDDRRNTPIRSEIKAGSIGADFLLPRPFCTRSVTQLHGI